jgi:hypothetical protein
MSVDEMVVEKVEKLVGLMVEMMAVKKVVLKADY